MAHTNEKQLAHELIERLAPSQLTALVRFLEAMRDPVARSITNAPADDDQLPERALLDLVAVRSLLDRGVGILYDEVLADFVLSPDDFARMGRAPLDTPKPTR